MKLALAFVAALLPMALVAGIVVVTDRLHARAMRREGQDWEAAESARRREALAAGRPFIPNPNPYRYWMAR